MVPDVNAAPATDGDNRNRPFAPSQKVSRLAGANLTLELDSRVRATLGCSGRRLEARVVGLDPYAYIILRVRLAGQETARLSLDDRITVQYVHEGSVYGFRSCVSNHIRTPAQLLFVEYPDSLEKLDLRREERVNCSLQASIFGAYGEHKCMVQDLTTGGCRISVRTKANYSIRRISVDEELSLLMDLGEFGRVKTPVSIRNVNCERGVLYLGTMFTDLSDNERDKISFFVDELSQHLA